MKVIEATIFVVPTAKGRPRFATFAGRVHAYTPAKTASAQSLICATIRQEVMKQGVFDPGVPLSLTAVFYIEKPKSTPKRVEYPVKKPDLDNYFKTLGDALNKYVFPDDSQIVVAHISKIFGSPPRIYLRISEVLP